MACEFTELLQGLMLMYGVSVGLTVFLELFGQFSRLEAGLLGHSVTFLANAVDHRPMLMYSDGSEDERTTSDPEDGKICLGRCPRS